MIASLPRRWLVVGVACLAVGGLWVGVSQAAQSGGAATPEGASCEVTARLFATVAKPDPGPFGTSLEGAAFDSHGHFYFVNTTAPSGDPKLMTLDLATRKVSDLYTDSTSMLNCIGFGPDGTMYLCDIKGGKVVSYDQATRRLTDVLTKIGSSAFVPDDLTIDKSGNMYIADYQGTPTAPTGRILLRTSDGSAQVILTGLAHANGTVLDPAQDALWVDEDLSGRLDHVAEQLSSPADQMPAVTLHTAAYLNLGADAYSDSLTMDGQGNIYLAVYGAAEVLEFNPSGIQIGKVVFPRAPHVTHVAIQPGTRRAFATASGPGGGYREVRWCAALRAVVKVDAGVRGGG